MVKVASMPFAFIFNGCLARMPHKETHWWLLLGVKGSLSDKRAAWGLILILSLGSKFRERLLFKHAFKSKDMFLNSLITIVSVQLEKMRLTVQYLQDALTDLKKKASSTTALPRVFDVWLKTCLGHFPLFFVWLKLLCSIYCKSKPPLFFPKGCDFIFMPFLFHPQHLLVNGKLQNLCFVCINDVACPVINAKIFSKSSLEFSVQCQKFNEMVFLG